MYRGRLCCEANPRDILDHIAQHGYQECLRCLSGRHVRSHCGGSSSMSTLDLSRYAFDGGENAAPIENLSSLPAEDQDRLCWPASTSTTAA